MAKVQFCYPNPDREFVLQGGPPHYYRNAPGFLSNSMLTDTSKNLSQHLYHPEKYGDDPQLRGSLRKVSRSLNRVNANLRRSLLMEDENNTRTGFVRNTFTQAELNEVLRDALNRNPPPKEVRARADWYTKPIHISEKVRVPMDSEDMLANRYFPVTLGESKSLELLDDIRPGSSKGPRRSKCSKTVHRPRSAHAGDELKRLDEMYLLTAESPFIKTANVSFTSPFNDELTKLRLEKLRLEELQYLELKRQAELERIRGPKPKWYELKSSEFHVEAGKNNELLRNSAQWDDLLRYRESLVDATNRLRSALEEDLIPA
ncbi:hypothetical protein PoB_000977100 [Plakobranchus ocellatus]|uniref:Enkurin domain-containing protein n=1 Tax=Plakobranchus ocellatus TaxID=259542 RepID=A0AAV3YJ42_9GAST|nr:hypothetical protein PoB_000977100 [Plakobranchus ocellatus]